MQGGIKEFLGVTRLPLFDARFRKVNLHQMAKHRGHGDRHNGCAILVSKVEILAILVLAISLHPVEFIRDCGVKEDSKNKKEHHLGRAPAQDASNGFSNGGLFCHTEHMIRHGMVLMPWRDAQK